MAVYTDISDEELAGLLDLYDLGAPLMFKGIAEGVSNSNFLLETTRGRFILTVFEHRAAPADLPFFMDVMHALAGAQFPAPAPQATRTGAYLACVRAKPCAIVSFLAGVSPRRPSAAQCKAIGATLAQMHLALADTDLARADALGPPAWDAMIQTRMNEAEALRPDLAVALLNDLTVIASGWPADLPSGIIHADLFPDNALLQGEVVNGVIDFYFACTGFWAYDLAVCLNAWCFEGPRSFNLTKGMNLIAGYESVRTLTIAERTALPILARGAALRFFATRLADWAATPPGALVKPKDPLEYADRLDFHRAATAASDYGG
ncbi:MAG: homoserine kinase [Caulobacterales bacterium]